MQFCEKILLVVHMAKLEVEQTLFLIMSIDFNQLNCLSSRELKVDGCLESKTLFGATSLLGLSKRLLLCIFKYFAAYEVNSGSYAKFG